MKRSKITAAILAAFMAFSAVPFSASADWETKNGNKIYVDDDGKMLKGFQTIGGKKYYFDKDGYMTTGWLTFKDTKYYFSSNGVMKTGWMTLKKSGKKYYFDTDGKMAVGVTSIDGEKYYFTKDGTMKTGWHELSDGTRYYFRKDGTMAHDCTLKIGGKKYTFKSNGKLKTSNSESSAPKDGKNVKPSKFENPTFGASPSTVLKSCGIGNYIYSEEHNSYTGTTIFGGKEVVLNVRFNSKNQLCSYTLFYEASYYEYIGFRDSLIEGFGYDYTYVDGSYMWTVGSTAVLLNYDFSDDEIMVLAMSFDYYEG